MVEIRISARFIERLRLLSEGRQEHIMGRLAWFQRWPHDKALRLRPLECLEGHYLIDSVRYDRIVLRLDPDGVYAAVDCGGHEVIELWEAAAPED